MKLSLQGGFGEKGRTSVAVEDNGTRVMLDAGIKVGATGHEYYPMLAGPADEIDALIISHAHEDHVGALCRLIALGYGGPIYMTAETRQEMPTTLAQYAEAGDLNAYLPPDDQIHLFQPGETLVCGDLMVTTGASGHVAGGVWMAVASGGKQVVYAADMVPESTVFAMDPLPACDLLILDCSYGCDEVPGTVRAREIAQWVAEHPDGCLLPTPLSGRSLELMAALDTPFAIEKGMRHALHDQIMASNALRASASELLRARLAAAIDWEVGEPLPASPLIVHDGMGVAGPSRAAIAAADAAGMPVLLTGHLPPGSPADLLRRRGRADWIRMPTHPTLNENVALWENAGRPAVLGHSCETAVLRQMQDAIPALKTELHTGQSYTID
ncbi:MBL fold metallo-hydrolase [Pseudohoeflea sp. DP4N28-3]|uniref:MBL fold metallo-hydrolase n=1 Tax=Pseudohoeflea coraliihabitans TaxID=2860393 RepID=A0ABS6WL39_9HYPH|nr:MBL fold metallo-hydrolase [Pseudohoeflea sp. DP4N28-3]